jgi:hypothetical protein
MKSTFLTRLQNNARNALIGALILIIGIPLYQFLVLAPAGYDNAPSSVAQSLIWIHTHTALFVGYRVLLILGFAAIIGLPFTLFRIIVAQEILGQDTGQDAGEEEDEQEEDDDDEEAGQAQHSQPDTTPSGETTSAPNAMPDFAWRGRGFAVLAAWLGISGLFLFPLTTLASTLYLLLTSSSSGAPLTGLFAVLTFTVGGGMIALSCLFFGAVITRRGIRLWPGSWLAFGYVALAIALLLSASAVEVALAPTAGQAVLSTPAILFFALWVLWFGIMVVRLKPE